MMYASSFSCPFPHYVGLAQHVFFFAQEMSYAIFKKERHKEEEEGYLN